jgi:hypothetical protein
VETLLGRLLVLPPNIRPDWRGFPEANSPTYLAFSSVTKKPYKLKGLSLERLSGIVKYFC